MVMVERVPTVESIIVVEKDTLVDVPINDVDVKMGKVVSVVMVNTDPATVVDSMSVTVTKSVRAKTIGLKTVKVIVLVSKTIESVNAVTDSNVVNVDRIVTVDVQCLVIETDTVSVEQHMHDAQGQGPPWQVAGAAGPPKHAGQAGGQHGSGAGGHGQPLSL